MEETIAAWLGGLMDGEGSIMLTNHIAHIKPSKRNPEGNSYWRKRPIVSIANCDRALLEACQQRTGMGRIYRHSRADVVNRKSESFTWRLTADEQRKILPAILPWLITKREQGELLLEALEIKELLTNATGRSVADRNILCKRRDAIQARISELNRRGRYTGEGGDAK
ncbi:MAG: hypothetical protein KGL39_46545 [Patescibacteria group bacterium]|nr:hypothetical protein [Patescibacteria group bacterium]